MSFQEAMRRHSAAEARHLWRVPFEHAGIERFARNVRALERALGEQATEGALVEPISALRAFRYRLTDVPLPIARVAAAMADELARAERLIDIAETVPDGDAVALALAVLGDIWDLVPASDDPLGDAVRDGLAQVRATTGQPAGRVAVVLSRSQFAPEVGEVMGPDVDVISETAAVALDSCCGIVAVGLPSWFEPRLLRCPPVPAVAFAYPAWAADPPVDLARLITTGNRIVDLGPSPSRGADAAPDLLDDDRASRVAWSSDMALTALRGEEGARDVAARLFGLDSGDFAFLETTGKVQVVDIGGSAVDITYGPVADSAVGEYIVLRVKGDSDYIAPLANALMGEEAEGLRTWQRLWKRSLSDAITALGLPRTTALLAAAGATHASSENVRRWAHAHHHIRPRDAADRSALTGVLDFGAIDGVDLWSGMERIDEAHHQAARVVRKRLLAELEAADLSRVLDDGWSDIEVEELVGEGALRIARIAWIDDDAHTVSSSVCRRLIPRVS